VPGDPWEITEKHLLTSSTHPYASMTSPQQVLILDTANPDIQKRMAPSGGNPPQKVLSCWLAGLQKQDADIVLVDHIESDAVLAQCLDYAASQLMLSAFGFKHVFDLLAYCLDCQIPPAILTSRVYALLAQHTVFLLCQACKHSDTTDATKQIMAQFVEEGGGQPEIFAPVGCPACYGTGYTEAIILFEILTMEPWLKELLLAHAPLIEIRKTAAEKGFSSLKQKCTELLHTGQTSLEQVLAIMI
jgi:type II secretory ATPase GspE/PulE/Tfp pilus assembly ATPase PilB-like protein